MDRDKLVALAERVEAAECVGPALDEEIGRALAGPSGNWIGGPYSTSIDAAMTLVPEGARALIDNDGCHCRLTKDSYPWLGYHALSHTMPLAITAAALRALASTPREGDGL